MTYAAYKILTSGHKTYTDESEGLESNIPSKQTGGKKARIAIIISNKIDFKKRA